jgi:hypothetical protein
MKEDELEHSDNNEKKKEKQSIKDLKDIIKRPEL